MISHKPIIYLIVNKLNGKKYVGQTKNSLNRRWFSGHVSSANRGALTPLHCAIRKYGEHNFEYFEIVTMLTEDKTALSCVEKQLIKQFNTKTPKGYNLTDGGEGGSGIKPSKETLSKISRALKGRIFTPEHKEKLRLSALGNRKCLGRTLSEETKRRIGDGNRGKKYSVETRKKMSDAAKGNKRCVGRKVSEQTKEKLRLSHLGKTPSLETRKKMSQSRKKYLSKLND